LFQEAAPAVQPVVRDTPVVVRRPRAVEHSDAYYTRLAIHRYASYAMVPVFVAEYICGKQLLDKSADAPQWAKTGHRVFATSTAVLFGANTLTGGWNWLESRNDSEHRTLRNIHAMSMPLADAGFTTVCALEKAG